MKETDDKKLTLADFVSLIVNSKAGFNGQLYVDHMNEIAVKTKVYGATVQLLIFLHTPITQKLLEFYKCIQVPTSGGPEYPTRYYVTSDTRFECCKYDWYFYLPFNIFFNLLNRILFLNCIIKLRSWLFLIKELSVNNHTHTSSKD